MRAPIAGPAGSGGGNAGSDSSFGNATMMSRPAAPIAGARAPAAPNSTDMPRERMELDDCPGAVSQDVAERLRDPKAQPGGSRWLYPYDATVFPRGLVAPLLQWEAPAGGASAVFIHLRSMYLDYQICLPLSEPMRVQVPQAAWDLAAAQSIGAADPLGVDVVLASGASAVRLPALTLTFALADLKGAIYYNTYSSARAIQMGIGGGVVMRILPREPEPSVFAVANESPDQCIGCHSVSADGSRMVAEVHAGGGILEGQSRSFDLLAAGGGDHPTPIRSDLRRAGFSGVYPDGSRYLTTGRTTDGVGMGSTFTGAPGNITGTFGAEETKLFDMQSGAELASTGIHPYAYMPSFAVDGRQVVFNKMDSSATTGHTLAVMDFDATANTFGNLRDVFSDPTRFPSWPFFLPDVVTGEVQSSGSGKRVLFALNTNADFLTGAVSFGVTPSADLWWVDLDTGMAAALDRVNGLDDAGNVYLPYGEREAHKNFVPTVSPVAAGGYFWVFFSSRRSYGNKLIVDPALNSPDHKKIWGAAIDIGAAPGTDASHPPFYLPNQELESGNIRAFAALEPCRAEGSACTSGIDCCCGFCLTEPNAAAGSEGECGCEPNRCANLDERCDTAADCCDSKAACIGGFCQIPVVK